MMNSRRGIVAVWTDGGYTIIELLGDEVGIGDRLTWAGSTPLGGHTIRNVTEGVDIDVFIQDHHVSPQHLRPALLL